MNILGFDITRAPSMASRVAALETKATAQGSVPAPSRMSTLWGFLREPFAGAWQRNIRPEVPSNLLAFAAVYACVSIIADDISKMRMMLMQSDDNGIDTEVFNSPLDNVIQKPNRYQTRIQFLSQWMTSKLLFGNTYILKERDNRKVVTGLYILNPGFVLPLVAVDGSVYYQVGHDYLAGIVEGGITFPDSEIIHDRMCTMFHPLVGVSPIYACGASATQGIRIQANSNNFFENMSRPSGQLTSPNTISDETANRLKNEFEKNLSGSNIGRLLVAGDGLKYEGMAIPAADAQLIEQLKWTVEDVARAFKTPLHKLAAGNPAFNNVAALNQDYYSQCLQNHIEGIELLLTEGLGIKPAMKMSVQLDIAGLLRMDPETRATVSSTQMKAGLISPNEARILENRGPVKGGETPYLQQQNYSLAALAARDAAQPAPSGVPIPSLIPDDETVPAADDPNAVDDDGNPITPPAKPAPPKPKSVLELARDQWRNQDDQRTEINTKRLGAALIVEANK